MVKATAGIILALRVLWLIVDVWYWAGLSFRQELQKKYNLLSLLACYGLLASKLLGVLRLAPGAKLDMLKAE